MCKNGLIVKIESVHGFSLEKWESDQSPPPDQLKKYTDSRTLLMSKSPTGMLSWNSFSIASNRERPFSSWASSCRNSVGK